MVKESSGSRYGSRRGSVILLVIVASALWFVHAIAQPQLAPGQIPLTDIQSIKTLRTQFNHDAGDIRLIILVVPT